MQKLLYKSLAIAVTSVLLFPASATQAQSSFVSSSSSSETEAPPAKDAKATHLENLLNELMTQGGMTATAEVEGIAKDHLDRSMNDELPLFEGMSYNEDYDSTSISVSVFPTENIDFEIAQVQSMLQGVENSASAEPAQFSALVDTDGENYYTAMVFIF